MSSPGRPILQWPSLVPDKMGETVKSVRPALRSWNSAALILGMSIMAVLFMGVSLLSSEPTRTKELVIWHAPTENLVASIPRVIHQSYKTVELPEDFETWSQTWKRNHPDWRYMFWTDEDNRKLVETYTPWFLPTYDGFKKPIQRADSSRYVYMYVYGGVYADLDVESIKPLDDLLKGESVVLGKLSEDKSFKDRIPNAIMASVPGHPFWMLCLAEVVQNFNSDNAEFSTGPHVLTRVMEKYYDLYQLKDIKVHEHSVLYPFRWQEHTTDEKGFCSSTGHSNPNFSPEKCKALFPDAYTVTYWTHGWE